MRFCSAEAEDRFEAVRARLPQAVVACDFDGTLAPIVSDPTQAFIHPAVPDQLLALGPHVAALAIITGRPVETVLGLGRLESVGEPLARAGCDLLVYGHYGNERWSARNPQIVTPSPQPGLLAVRAALAGVLQDADAADAFVEDKGLAIAVHTRRMAEPEAAFERLLPAMREAAEAHGLHLEPGRLVLEVRAPGVDKGGVLLDLIQQSGAAACLFAGDDLGDLPAFDALDFAEHSGVATCRVAVASAEQTAVAQRADIVVDDPAELVGLLRRLVG